MEVNLKLPPRGEWVRQRLTDETMASLVRLLAYSPETASMLPLLIHQPPRALRSARPIWRGR